MKESGTAENGQPCTTQGDGRLLTEMQGVSARDGECLINYDGALASDAHGVATPEQAIVAAGFGRYTLTRYEPKDALNTMVYVYETDGPTRVGAYSVNVMADGSFIVHSVVASTPMK